MKLHPCIISTLKVAQIHKRGWGVWRVPLLIKVHIDNLIKLCTVLPCILPFNTGKYIAAAQIWIKCCYCGNCWFLSVWFF